MLVVGAVAFSAAVVSDVSQPATAPMATVPPMVQPLQDDLQTLLESVKPNPPDLSPSTTDQLQAAVTEMAGHAADEDYAATESDLDDLQNHLAELLDSPTGTQISQNRGKTVQRAIDTVRDDLAELK
ncbi:hypothetical protein B7R54_19280 [Subtercola boreus]|uniref:Uncharacterized protein n=1 Tax=Subtercola boreus TaxID=120213 RepID=A0A3E0VAY1_9MICO|nr:hypothetical protein B7R54_19280 [Subtercola boreus]